MQTFEQTNSEIRELTDADLEAISAGNWFGDAVRWVVHHLQGNGDLRRSTDRPN